MRWWWDQLLTPGAFSLPDALKEVDAVAAAGFGRMEIAWAAASYGTAQQRADLAAVAQRVRAHGMQLDMTLGASWPWHTPSAQGELGQTELMYGRTDATGPSTFDADVSPAIGDSSPRGTLIAVTAARVLRAGPAVTKADSPPSSSTVLDPSSLVDLTRHVVGRHLTWKVPAGNWIVFSFWRRTQSSCGAFTSVPGSCVSLIDAKSVRAALSWTGTNQIGSAATSLRGVGNNLFEDSLETTADELYWSRDFPQQFKQTRGYDPAKYLPLMFVQGVTDVGGPGTHEPTPDFDLPAGEGARYRHDYFRTVTDLYVSGHVLEIQRWAAKHGMRFRGQLAYNLPLDPILSTRTATQAGALVEDSSLDSGDAGLPGPNSLGPAVGTDAYLDPTSPQWRASLDHYRQITSGAAQGGGLEVSTELGDSFGYELRRSLQQYKLLMDREWAAGVSRPILHGMTNSPAGTPWPGASHFGGIVGESLNYRTWPEWSNFTKLNDYWARGSLLLQQGAARTDVAVLREGFLGTVKYDGLPLEQRGYTLGYLDPAGLAAAPQGADGSVYPNGPAYRAIVVDLSQVYVGSGRLPADALRALDAASARGLRVVFVGALPSRGLTGVAPAREDSAVRALVHSILARKTTAHVPNQASVAEALASLGLHARAQWSLPARVYTQARETTTANYYYIWNAVDAPVSLDGTFEASGAPQQLDLWSGQIRDLAQYKAKRGRFTVPLRLASHGVAVLAFPKSSSRPHVVSSSAESVVALSGGAVEVRDSRGGAQTVVLSDGERRTVQLPTVSSADAPVPGQVPNVWSLQVTTFGPEGTVQRPAVPLPALADWRTIPGLSTESGVGTYRSTIALKSAQVEAGHGWTLSLGRIDGSVSVSVNGHLVSRDLDPRSGMDVTPWLRAGDNELQVVLATTPFNKAVAASATTVQTRPLWSNSLTQGLQPYGLQGPVALVPYARARLVLPRGAALPDTRRAGGMRSDGRLAATGLAWPVAALGALCLTTAVALQHRRRHA